jgi:hypothetical protein
MSVQSRQLLYFAAVLRDAEWPDPAAVQPDVVGADSLVVKDEHLLNIGQPGSRVTVRLGDLYSPNAADIAQRTWRYADIEVEAHPFAGTINTVLTAEDIQEYASLAGAFTSGQREHVVFGGDRAAEVVLQRHDQTVEVSVTPSGDDPWPLLRFLIFPS